MIMICYQLLRRTINYCCAANTVLQSSRLCQLAHIPVYKWTLYKSIFNTIKYSEPSYAVEVQGQLTLPYYKQIIVSGFIYVEKSNT